MRAKRSSIARSCTETSSRKPHYLRAHGAFDGRNGGIGLLLPLRVSILDRPAQQENGHEEQNQRDPVDILDQFHMSPPMASSAKGPDGTLWHAGRSAVAEAAHGAVLHHPCPDTLAARTVARVLERDEGDTRPIHHAARDTGSPPVR